MLPQKTLVYLLAMLSLSACTVTNSLYVNDPEPVQKGAERFYLGIGTGVRAKVDSVDNNGNISFSNEITLAPNLFFGGQVAIKDNLNLRFAVHLPYIIGGFGARVGPQYTFFEPGSKFNMAVGTDLGFVLAKDSLEILGSTSALDIYANGAINADIFMPLAYKFSKNARIVITPRYSFNTLYIRLNTAEKESRKFSPQLASLAIGLYLNRIYLEASAFRFQGEYFPNVGLVYTFKPNEN
jgi:hypothetical protein